MNVRIFKNLFLILFVISAVLITKVHAVETTKSASHSSDVFVHLFEWNWLAIAAECEDFLGPNGYSAAQISPPQEHVTGSEWWTRYQPVSYKIESRGGSRSEFSEMTKRCKAVGVDIYADVLINHMAGQYTGKGVAGSDYSQYQYPVPYSKNDFHHCGRKDNKIANYQDLWEVQNCNLGTLVDLNTAKPDVQNKIVAYLNDLILLGVSGFRLDAAKHIAHKELKAILSKFDANPYIFSEVIDRGGEPINASDYLSMGDVTETKYPMDVSRAFKESNLSVLENLIHSEGYLPKDSAVVFIDNHDVQRGHAGGDGNLSFKDGALYDLANVFMLSWPYGYPKVMSSYHFENSDQGPPLTQPIVDGSCNNEWVCEHRRPSRIKMIAFRKAMGNLPVTHWLSKDNTLVSFGRGNQGHVIINIANKPVRGNFTTDLPPGKYCNMLSIETTKSGCTGNKIVVNAEGQLQVTIKAKSALVIYN